MWSKNRTTMWAAWLTLIIILCSSVTVAFGGRARTARDVNRSQYNRALVRMRQSLQQVLNVSTRSDIAVKLRPVGQALRRLHSGVRRSALNVISFELNETLKRRPLEGVTDDLIIPYHTSIRGIEKLYGWPYTKEILEKANYEIRYEGLMFDNRVQILKIKNQLDQLKYLTNDGTAEWNKSFTDAIKRFQSENGLEVDGIPGLKTQDKLDEEIRKLPLGALPWGGEAILGDMPTRDSQATV